MLEKSTLNRWRCRPSEVGVNVDVLGLWSLLLVMWREVGWRGIHQSWRRLHLRSQRRGAMRHVRRDEGLKGLLRKRTPVILEVRRSAWTWRVVLRGMQLLLMRLMRRKHSRRLLLIGKRKESREEGKPKQPVKTPSVLLDSVMMRGHTNKSIQQQEQRRYGGNRMYVCFLYAAFRLCDNSLIVASYRWCRLHC